MLDVYVLTAHGGQERTRSQSNEHWVPREGAIILGANEAFLKASPRPG